MPKFLKSRKKTVLFKKKQMFNDGRRDSDSMVACSTTPAHGVKKMFVDLYTHTLEFIRLISNPFLF